MKINTKKFCFIFLITLLTSFAFCTKNKLKIHFINVGEGDSILIETPSSKNILIDTGNAITALKVVKYLEKQNINSIDKLIITHPHPDHFSGVFTVAQLIDTKSFFDNGQDISKNIASSDFYRWYNNFFRKNKKYKTLKIGDTLIFKKVKLKVIWPYNTESNDWNANSLVIMLAYKNFKCLLMGDANKTSENKLIKKEINIKTDVLKAGHHGAGDTGSIAFVKKVAPEVVIVSINKNNIRNYPEKETLELYKSEGAKVYKTYEDGNIVVSVDSNGEYSITTSSSVK